MPSVFRIIELRFRFFTSMRSEAPVLRRSHFDFRLQGKIRKIRKQSETIPKS